MYVGVEVKLCHYGLSPSQRSTLLPIRKETDETRRWNCLLYSIIEYWGCGSISPLILNYGARWRWVIIFVLQVKSPITHWIGGWVGPRASLDVLENRQFSCTCQETNHDSLVVHPLALSLYQLCYPGLKEAALCWTKRLDYPKASVRMVAKEYFLSSQ